MILIFCIFILFVNSIVCDLTYNTADSSASNIKKCAALGEYCQYQWDCCSNNCLTFSYKCIKNRQQIQTGIAEAESPLSEHELNGISTAGNIDELVNRFGNDDNNNDDDKKIKNPTYIVDGDDSSSSINIGSNLPPRCLVLGERCVNSRQCCSSVCSIIDRACINRPTETVNCLGYRQQCNSNQQCCSRSCSPFHYTCDFPYHFSSFGFNPVFPVHNYANRNPYR